MLPELCGTCAKRAILCLIPRMTVTSPSAPKDTRCKSHPLCVNPGVPFWMREKTHKLRARWQASSSGIRADVTVVLEVRQSIENSKSENNPQNCANYFKLKLLVLESHYILGGSGSCSMDNEWWPGCISKDKINNRAVHSLKEILGRLLNPRRGHPHDDRLGTSPRRNKLYQWCWRKTSLRQYLITICDVIKQNESELADIDFEIQAIIAFNFLCIWLFRASLTMAISMEPQVQFQWGFHQNIALTVRHICQLKTLFSFYSSSDSFCLIASHTCMPLKWH